MGVNPRVYAPGGEFGPEPSLPTSPPYGYSTGMIRGISETRSAGQSRLPVRGREANKIGCPVHGETTQRDEPLILRPDSVRLERQGESHVRNVLRISPSEDGTGLPEFVNVVRLFMFGDVSPKDSERLLKGVRGLAAPLREFVAMCCYLVEQVLGHVQIVAADDEEVSGRGVA